MLTSRLARSAGAGITLVIVTIWGMSGSVPSAHAATSMSSSVSTAVLAQGVGMSGRPSVRVRRLQRVLERAGFDVGPTGVDGRFGPFTAAAVRRMQNAYGLVPDAVVGPKTRRVAALIRDRQRLQRERARGGSKPPRPRAPQASPTPQTAPSSTTPAQPAPARSTPTQSTPPQSTPTQSTPAQPSPTATTERARAQRPASRLPLILSTIAVLLAGAALARSLVRTRRAPEGAALVGVPRDLYLEGHSADERVGTFSGYALATEVPSSGRRGATEERYLVDDPRKPVPVWVRRSEIRRSPSDLSAGQPVLGYVTADDDADREHEQFIAIEEACSRAGWELMEIIRDEDGPQMFNRPGLTRALGQIATGRARGLVIAEATRVAPSVGALGSLVAWFRDADAPLIALDLDLDTSTVNGRQMAATLIALAEWEASTERRARRGSATGKRPERAGRARQSAADERVRLVERIKEMRDGGMSLQAIADRLNKEGVPPLGRGATWRPAAVEAALGSPPRTTAPQQAPSNRRGEGEG
jgi:DNA invertase Pin-like site-specific DNA recombinase/peptidoglycan hydrolase-like protein with peptidoglycan-binding domain